MNNTAEILLTLAGIHIAMAITPGPNAVIVIQNAFHERRLGIIAAMGVWPAGVIWAGIGMFGLSALVEKVPQFKSALYLLCGGYLLWLGVNLFWKSFKNLEHLALHGKRKSAWKVFLSGFVSNALNPKGIPYWLSVFAATNASTMPVWYQTAAIVMMPSITFTWYCILSAIVSSKMLQQYFNKQQQWIDRVSGAIMIGFGAKLLMILV